MRTHADESPSTEAEKIVDKVCAEVGGVTDKTRNFMLSVVQQILAWAKWQVTLVEYNRVLARTVTIQPDGKLSIDDPQLGAKVARALHEYGDKYTFSFESHENTKPTDDPIATANIPREGLAHETSRPASAQETGSGSLKVKQGILARFKRLFTPRRDTSSDRPAVLQPQPETSTKPREDIPPSNVAIEDAIRKAESFVGEPLAPEVIAEIRATLARFVPGKAFNMVFPETGQGNYMIHLCMPFWGMQLISRSVHTTNLAIAANFIRLCMWYPSRYEPHERAYMEIVDLTPEIQQHLGDDTPLGPV